MPDAGTIVSEFCGLMVHRDAELLRPFLCDDASFHIQGIPPSHGIEAVIGNLRWQMDICPDLYEYEIVSMAAEGDVVMVERIDWTRSPVGIVWGCPILGVFVLENGMIKRWTDYWDRYSQVVAGGAAMV